MMSDFTIFHLTGTQAKYLIGNSSSDIQQDITMKIAGNWDAKSPKQSGLYIERVLYTFTSYLEGSGLLR